MIAAYRVGTRMTEQTADRIGAQIRKAAAEQGIDPMLPGNAFLLGKKTSQFAQPWLLFGNGGRETALFRGRYLAWLGNTDVFVLYSSNGAVVGFDREGRSHLSK